MRRLRYVLPEAIDRREVLRTAMAQRVLRRWPEIVGEMLAQRSQPDRFDKGTVWVSVQGSAWAQELRLLAPTILARIAEFSGDPNLVMDVRFGVRAAREWPEIPHPVQRAVDPDLEGMTIQEIKERRLKRWLDEEGTSS